jgi:hypothetical protein
MFESILYMAADWKYVSLWGLVDGGQIEGLQRGKKLGYLTAKERYVPGPPIGWFDLAGGGGETGPGHRHRAEAATTVTSSTTTHGFAERASES